MIVCWSCKRKVKAPDDWKKVKCPICFKTNIIPPQKVKDLDLKLDELCVLQYMSVVCGSCKYKMKTKKESDYVICGRCKKAVVVVKDVPYSPSGYPSITKEEYSLLKVKGKVFNPYRIPEDSPFWLEPYFEKKIKQNSLSISPLKNKDPIHKDKEYKSYITTINRVSNKIARDYLNPNLDNSI